MLGQKRVVSLLPSAWKNETSLDSTVSPTFNTAKVSMIVRNAAENDLKAGSTINVMSSSMEMTRMRSVTPSTIRADARSEQVEILVNYAPRCHSRSQRNLNPGATQWPPNKKPQR